MVVAPVVLYTDDTSGNVSKKWNKFDCFCISLAGLPLEEGRKFKNIHFICCSNKLSCLDMAEGIVLDLLELERGIVCFDVSLGKNIYVLSPIICALCDNARASELVNHLGSCALKYCRICMVSLFLSSFKIIYLFCPVEQ